MQVCWAPVPEWSAAYGEIAGLTVHRIVCGPSDGGASQDVVSSQASGATAPSLSREIRCTADSAKCTRSCTAGVLVKLYIVEKTLAINGYPSDIVLTELLLIPSLWQ